MIKKSEDPPERLLLILLLISLLVLARGDVKQDTVAEIKIEEREQTQGLAIIQGNSLMPIAAIYQPVIYTLGSLTEESTGLMDRIMECESNDDPTAKNPKSSAYGRCQMLKSTEKYCEKKWGLEIDTKNPEHQGYACERLLREEGTDHWLETEHCWGKYAYNKIKVE